MRLILAVGARRSIAKPRSNIFWEAIWAAIESPPLSFDHLVGARAQTTFVDCNARLRQPGLRQAFGAALKIGGVLVRQDALALRQREARIHLEKLRPCRVRVVRTPEMAVARGEQHAARIGAGGARDALEELLRGGLVLSQAEMRLRQEVQHDGRMVRVEPRRDRHRLERLGWAAGIHQRQSDRGMALSKIGVERDHAAKLRQRTLEIAPP